MLSTILWDFDGTLATRPGLWSQAMVEVLELHVPGHGFTREDFRPALRNAFPWHRHEVDHLHLCEPEAWWEEVSKLLAEAYTSVGVLANDAATCTAGFRQVFLDPSRWVLYDDTEPALTLLSERGFRHVIVSNHVPELADLIADLGLGHHFDDVITSAAVGYEKPHPEIFRRALSGLAPAEAIMVGDNPVADVGGAQALGLRAYLVRRNHDDHPYHPDLHSLVAALTLGDGDVANP